MQSIATVIGSGFSSKFTSIGIVIILDTLIDDILEITGAAFKLGRAQHLLLWPSSQAQWVYPTLMTLTS